MDISKYLNLLRIYAQGKYTHLVPHWKQTTLSTTSNTVLLIYATIEYVTHSCTITARCAVSKMKSKQEQEI